MQAINVNDYLSLIKDEKLRGIATAIIVDSTELLKLPASKSKKYHSPDECGEYGMLVHSLKAMNVGLIAARRRNDITRRDLDVIMTACLCHDLPSKYAPDARGEIRYNVTHPEDNAVYFEEVAKKHGLDIETIEVISRMIGMHHGKWSNFNNSWFNGKVMCQFCNIAQEADYFSSRPNFSIDYSIDVMNSLIAEHMKGLNTSKSRNNPDETMEMIKEMLSDRVYDYAYDTIIGIKESIDKYSNVTDKQKVAIQNIYYNTKSKGKRNAK